jgi:hypothetical protein
MSEEIPLDKRDELVLVIAQGKPVRAWARRNEIPKSTAARWAMDPRVRRQVQDLRRSYLDQALGKLARQATRTVSAIIELGDRAESESTRLRALRAALHDQIAVAEHSDLEYRMSEIERAAGIGQDNAGSHRSGPLWTGTPPSAVQP